jgi:hypothetical protein
MVPTPAPSPMLLFTGFESVTLNVSSLSMLTSPLTGTVIVLLVWPGAKETVPEVLA